MVKHSIEEVQGGGKDIVFPTLVPNEQITISYMYFPPTTYERVTQGVKSDEGFAQVVPVLLTRQYPRWVQRVLKLLLLAGAVAVLYLLTLAGIAAWRRWM
jgi:hypothetical protein